MMGQGRHGRAAYVLISLLSVALKIPFSRTAGYRTIPTSELS
jgi:hypothetical protein